MSYRVAVLGAGIGEQHCAAIAALPDLFEVTVICDRDDARADALARPLGAKTVTDISDALAEDVDIIDICLPPMLHAPTAIAALEAGHHVICEKPLAGSIKDAEAMIDAADRMQKRLFPVFQYRYGPGVAAIHHLRAKGLLGAPRVATLETHWNRGADYYAIPWRGTRAYEMGGVIVSHAIHIHDLLGTLMGQITDVSATLSTAINPIETEDCAALHFRTSEGAIATSSVTLGAAADTSRLRLVYEHATVESGLDPYAPGATPWSIKARNPADQSAIDAALATVPKQDLGYLGLFKDVAMALSGRLNAAVKPSDGLASIELATAIYLSANERRTVALPIDRTHPTVAGWSVVSQ